MTSGTKPDDRSRLTLTGQIVKVGKGKSAAEYARFESMLRGLLSVPKREIDDQREGQDRPVSSE